MKEVDALIVGGGPAAIITAVTARQNYKDAKIAVVRPEKYVIIPCGIPYIFGTLHSVEKDKIPDEVLIKKGIDLIKDYVDDVDLEGHVATLRSGEKIKYKKLVLATGSKPSVPPIPGVDKKNIFPVTKNPDNLEAMLEVSKKAKDIVVIGGGFIGVEFADELVKNGSNVSIVELLPHLLQLSFDDEFCEMAEERLKDAGVKIFTGRKVVEIQGDDSVSAVKLDDGTVLKADMVVLATGAKPNVDLAKKIGLKIGVSGAIEVDEYLKTSHPDVFAVGDCAEKRCFFTRDPRPVMLASIATAEARVAGANLFELKVVRQIKGTVGIFATYVNGLALGAAGMIERRAKEINLDYVIGTSQTVDKHPGCLPNASKVFTKVITSKQGQYILGAQIAGGTTAGEIINLLGFAIQNNMTACELANLQIGTHPLLTPAPTVPASLSAALNAIQNIEKE